MYFLFVSGKHTNECSHTYIGELWSIIALVRASGKFAKIYGIIGKAYMEAYSSSSQVTSSPITYDRSQFLCQHCARRKEIIPGWAHAGYVPITVFLHPRQLRAGMHQVVNGPLPCEDCACAPHYSRGRSDNCVLASVRASRLYRAVACLCLLHHDLSLPANLKYRCPVLCFFYISLLRRYSCLLQVYSIRH